ncbi:hypothetical protein F5Y18DRAFT_307225 [Xylariaceae sp. FL1019]|nr:hypothetical protein F5Y18DRAFT_307225 [Xylariaceae sp. FL1019]
MQRQLLRLHRQSLLAKPFYSFVRSSADSGSGLIGIVGASIGTGDFRIVIIDVSIGIIGPLFELFCPLPSVVVEISFIIYSVGLAKANHTYRSQLITTKQETVRIATPRTQESHESRQCLSLRTPWANLCAQLNCALLTQEENLQERMPAWRLISGP